MRLYALGIKKNNSVDVVFQSEDLNDDNQFNFRDKASFTIQTENAFCVVFEGRFFPVFSDFSLLKFKKALHHGENKMRFRVIGFMQSKSFEFNVTGKYSQLNSVNPPKKFVLRKPISPVGSVGEIRLKVPTLSERNSKIALNTKKLLTPDVNLIERHTKLVLTTDELENELRINRNQKLN